jgi:DnaJ-class molecular chaperone
LVGFSKTFNHLDGHEVKVEQAAVTKPGQIMKIVGEGMPHFNYPSDKGDLYIEFSIIMPESVSEQHKAGKKLFFLCLFFFFFVF